jgi:hypothetical protein
MTVVYSTGLGLHPEFGRLLADECAAYLGLRFPSHLFDVELCGTSPLGHRSYCVLLRSPATDEASILIQAAAEAFAYGFRTGWTQREQRPDLT